MNHRAVTRSIVFAWGNIWIKKQRPKTEDSFSLLCIIASILSTILLGLHQYRTKLCFWESVHLKFSADTFVPYKLSLLHELLHVLYT